MDILSIMKEVQKAWDEFPQTQKKQLLYIADEGKNSCPACIINDGKKFDLEDPNLPQLPIHPNCHCRYVPITNTNKDVSKDVEKYRITQTLRKTYRLQEGEAKSLAEQIIKVRNENLELRRQKIFLIFNGRYLMSSDGKLLLNAVSGKAVSENITINQATVSGFISETIEREFDYSYSRQGERNIGGIPQGLYYVESKEQRSAKTSPWSHIVKSSGWGNYSWPLHPNKTSDTRKRSGFFIHGGSDFGSAGCIDLQKKDSVFQKYFDSTGLSFIYVCVNYETPNVKIQEKKYKAYPIIPRQY